jgi:hypothetical protein
MNYVGIDLSLNSTGLVSLSTKSTLLGYALINPDVKKLTNEERLDYNAREVLKFIETYSPDVVGIEDLSYNSISSSKDEIAANFWRVRCEIRRNYPSIDLRIVPVLSWRSPLFNKTERDKLKADTKILKELKTELKGIKDKVLKAEKVLENQDLIQVTNIKYLTFKKLPEDVQFLFEPIGFNKGAFDLSDAYHITDYLRNKA